MLIQILLDFMRDTLLNLISPVFDLVTSLNILSWFNQLFAVRIFMEKLLAPVFLSPLVWPVATGLFLLSFNLMIMGTIVRAIVRRIP